MQGHCAHPTDCCSSREPSFADHPYASFLHEVEKPARYIGGEFGQIRKNWQRVGSRICLAFPDIYDVGMSHIGTRILYHVLNGEPDILCERAFAPWFDLEARLRQQGLPLVSLENARALREFDVVGISLQHELVFTNCLTLLDLGGVPLRACDRTDADPLVLAGGSVATHPEPVAPFFDAFVVGDGERKAVEVTRQWTTDRRDGMDRQARLRRLAALGGVYVPALYETRLDESTGRTVVGRPTCEEAPFRIRRALLADIDDVPFPETFPTGGPETIFDRLSVEIARGCMQGCRFCQAGMIFRPERERDPQQLVDIIERAVRAGGHDELSLTSLSTADYTRIGELVRDVSERLQGQSVAIGVSSLRAYGLDDGVLDQIRQVRATGLTLAPEAASQRLRDVINKNIDDDQILQTADRALHRGWDRLKLYFMIGLPTETIEEVSGIVAMMARLRQVGRRARARGRPVRVTGSVSTFVPKPHTPFQWFAMDGLETIAHKQGVLRDAARERNIDLKVHEAHGSVLEGILSRGDRRLAEVIERAWRMGARFDAWDGRVKWQIWCDALQQCGLSSSMYLDELPIDGALAWDHIDVGVSREFLLKERDRSLRGVTSPPCGRPAARRLQQSSEVEPPDEAKLVCLRCGVDCDLDVMRERLKHASTPPSPAASRDAPSEASPQSPVVASALPGAMAEAQSGLPAVGSVVEPTRCRMRFEKLGRSALMGHLDLVRELPRVLRRAGVPLCYSKGFHPKPVLSFGPALSLGVPSFEEYVDFKTPGPVDVDAWMGAVSECCAEGLRVTAISRLGKNDPPIGRVVIGASYVLALSPAHLLAAGDDHSIADYIARWFAMPDTRVVRNVNGVDRELDLRTSIRGMELGDSSDLATLALAGVSGTWCPVRVEVRFGSSSTPRMVEIARALTGSEATPFRAVRTRLALASTSALVPDAGHDGMRGVGSSSGRI